MFFNYAANKSFRDFIKKTRELELNLITTTFANILKAKASKKMIHHLYDHPYLSSIIYHLEPTNAGQIAVERQENNLIQRGL